MQGLHCRSAAPQSAFDISQGRPCPLLSQPTQLQGRNALESDFHNLSCELDELAASLRQTNKPTSVPGQSRLDAQLRQQQRYETALDRHQQPSWQTSDTGSGLRQLGGHPHSRHMPSMPAHLNSIPEKDGFRPFSNSSNRPDSNSQGNVAAQPDQESHDPEAQSGWQQEDSHRHGQRQSSQQGDAPRRSSRGYSPSPGSVLGCPSLRSLPVLNNSFIVPAQAAKPKKVDRVTRYR